MINIFGYIWKNSKREQIKILAVVLFSLPFYYLSLDLPKYIIADALQGRAFPDGQSIARLFHVAVNLPAGLGGPRTLFEGLWLDRLSYLFALSGLFLLLVLINGLFKYVVNMRKGALGERLLQRLRFDLFSALLSFKPETLQRIKPSEAATVIKDEVEPIGGFVGDAFVQPVFLGGQALTALAFILVQNVPLGVIAASMILVQGLIIPRLRREQIRLGKQRQIVSRAFAGKIGEVVESIGEIANHGTAAVEKGQVAQRLEQLFGIRYRLYERKFAVKMLNNLLAQITPFLFYAVGGYFALTGHLDLGQLIAVIAAYRDLPSPIKELIDWDQQRLDVEVKFHQVVEHFGLQGDDFPGDGAGGEEAAGMQAAAGHAAACQLPGMPVAGRIAARALTVVNPAGDCVLDRISLSLPLQKHIALRGEASEGAGVLAQLLGGSLSASEGTLTLAGVALSSLSRTTRGRLIAYVGPEPVVLDGTLRDNILYSLRRAETGGAHPLGWSIDPSRAQAADEAELARKLLDVLRIVGLAEPVFRLGLSRKLDVDAAPELVARTPEIRGRIRAKLAARGAGAAIEPYDPARYARNASIAENILFGVPSDPALIGERLADHAPLRSVLAGLDLVEPLVGIGRRMAATILEIFRDLSPGHVLFERFSFIAAEDLQGYRELLARFEAGAAAEADHTRLIGLAFLYIEPRHRLGLLDGAIEGRLLAARAAFRERIAPEPAPSIVFYDPQRYCAAAPLRDNLLFGLLAHETADEAIRDTLEEFALDADVYRFGLDQPAGYGGRLLFPAMKAQLALARGLIKQPELLILNNALSAFSRTEARLILDRIRAAMAGRTLIVASGDIGPDHGYDLTVAFTGARLAGVQDAAGAALPQEAPAPSASGSTEPGVTPDREEEIRALRSVTIFTDLDIAQLKLLAFTSERVTFAQGEVLFRQGDEADAAYVLLSGTADVLIETDGGPPVRASRVVPHAIIGEMGLVTGDPRSATILATAPIEALELRKDVFLALLTEFPPMALSVMRLMARRLQDNLATVRRQGRDG
ncbi:putative ABC transport system ATP-binding protein [Angulomicrobium tetraedrale]|uniref:Putative ABC transport system ATP-binding protein n=1 Tax=Ancylobacter tetraedralis TaxID=217068 RepID=A0A839ZB90_9HYPH|nr:cyclic nucleotide-binding domain-containing protein [Ancylobacter tetraedralis]MBB3771966.1 putative ABC transport system ATP-binding protein [Ancylobacter tetraedralis]